MEQREVQAILALCRLHDVDCMVRPATLERAGLSRYLEDGATGLMIPFVSDADAAWKVIQAVKFPPAGERGLDGASLDGDYGLEAWKLGGSYTSEANHETFVVAQIETPEAVHNVEKIAAVPGINCLFIGSGDLRERLVIRESNGMSVNDAAVHVARMAREYKVAWGIAVRSIEDLSQYHRLGAQLIPWGGDFLLTGMLENCKKELDSALSHLP